MKARTSWPAAIVFSCGALAAQTRWSADAHAAAIRIVGEGAATQLVGTAVLPAGTYAVDFGADADGKPQSLRLDCADGDDVHVAVTRAGPAARIEIAADDVAWRRVDDFATPSLHARVVDAPDRRDYWVSVTVSAGSAGGAVGLLARYGDERHRYRLWWDRERNELQLDRRLGGDVMVLARMRVPGTAAAPHTLTLEVRGFRLAAFVDDVLLLDELDGALTAGGFGTIWSGDEPTFAGFAVEPAAPPRDSAAIVQRDGRAAYLAATTVSPGHLHVLEIALDRPHPLVPRDVGGSEPWLLQPPAAPTCLLADWRGSLGPGGIGEVERPGRFACELRWPPLSQPGGLCGLVRALLVTYDGEAVAGASPWAPVRF